MNLLIISHPCVRPVNQQFYAAVERLTRWSLTVVAPASWRDEYGPVDGLERWPSFQGSLRAVPVWLPGHVPLHSYRSFLKDVFREANPDAVYVHHEPYALATAQVYLANYQNAQCPIGFYSAQNIIKRYPPPFPWLERMVYKGSSFAFPVSYSVEETLRAKGYDNAATILPLAINPELYAPHPMGRKLGNQWRRHPEEVILGYVGRFAGEKGLETLLQALSQIRNIPWRQVFVGVGEDETKYRGLADAFGIAERIEWCGYVAHAEVPRYLSAFDILVLPSETRKNWKEQFGRVLIESMACGTPVIGSDSGEIPHIVRHTGGGVLFPEQSPIHLAQRIRELALDPFRRTQLAAAGRRSVLEHYTEEVVAERFVATIERAVAGEQNETTMSAIT